MVENSGITIDAFFPADAVIKIEEQGTAGSIQTITTRVTNFSDGGGTKDTESVPHFGDSFLVILKPQEDFDVSFDVDVTNTEWAQIISDATTIVGSPTTGGSFIESKSGGNQNPFKVKVEWQKVNSTTGSKEGYKIVYYNARGVEFTKDNAADDRLTGTISFAIAPTDSNGSGQKYEWESNDLANVGIGSATAGSYGASEITADGVFTYAPGSQLF